MDSQGQCAQALGPVSVTTTEEATRWQSFQLFQLHQCLVMTVSSLFFSSNRRIQRPDPLKTGWVWGYWKHTGIVSDFSNDMSWREHQAKSQAWILVTTLP